ncbi:hypothetical protein bcere0012_31200 [Bacillus cereus BDRD-ST24]|nr:hypothetical protein bcere0012_31200 [Bacillus cereus BDRD-ST24]
MFLQMLFFFLSAYMQYVSLQLWPFKEKSFSYIKQLSYFM